MQDKTTRVALFVSPSVRDMANELAKATDRGQRHLVEFLIKREHKKLKRLKRI